MLGHSVAPYVDFSVWGMRRNSWIAGLLVGAALAGAPPVGAQRALERIAPAWRDPSLVTTWSRRGAELAFADESPPPPPFAGLRALALMHLAMHDALNAVVPVYRRYAAGSRDTAAHPLVAAAQAAHDVLAAVYPGKRQALAAALAADLAGVPDNDAKTRGRALGRTIAGALLAVRRDDGWDAAGTYAFRSGAGAYQTTPDWQGFVLQPGFRGARPFAMERSDQFRPPPPPALGSAGNATALAEVRATGAARSTARTPDQTGYAVWWMEFAETSVNRLARELVAERHTHAWQAARLFALLNVSLYDGYVATWDAKYEFNHWRPYTAIRATADSAWESLRPAPPFPEYTSAHAAGCSAAFEILAGTFGDSTSFRMATTTAPPDMPERHFTSFRAAARECADSRVRLGWHFRYATEAGLALGQAVARFVIERHLTASP
jgi:hypothetical protein